MQKIGIANRNGVKKARGKGLLTAAVVMVFIIGGAFSAESQPLQSAMKQRYVVVIDPGHGGYDTGAVGSAGTTEKHQTLSIATMIAHELKRINMIEPVLTRTDDYAVSLFERTAMANRLQAAAFISIHLGSGFGNRTGDIVIFLHQPPSSEVPPRERQSDDFEEWQQLQSRRIESSRKLAQIVNHELTHRDIQWKAINIREAPLPLLEGADMPAIMIEIGRISHPIDEDRLHDSRLMFDIAQGIAAAAFTYILYRFPTADP